MYNNLLLPSMYAKKARPTDAFPPLRRAPSEQRRKFAPTRLASWIAASSFLPQSLPRSRLTFAAKSAYVLRDRMSHSMRSLVSRRGLNPPESIDRNIRATRTHGGLKLVFSSFESPAKSCSNCCLSVCIQTLPPSDSQCSSLGLCGKCGKSSLQVGNLTVKGTSKLTPEHLKLGGSSSQSSLICSANVGEFPIH